uniref:Putative cytochrome n=1 Tax=Culex tarsalis TaxID=7177 RepID=A0A1Q3FG72_CULTA
MWTVVLGIWIVVFGVFQYLKFVKKNAFAKHLPILNTSYPIIGNGLMFIGKPDHEKFQNLRKLTSIDYPLTRFYLGPRVMVGTTEPEIAQQILTNPAWMDKPFIYEFFELPYGLLTSKHDIWKSHRKALSPAFNMKILQSFIPIFQQFSQKLVDRLAAHPDGTTIDIDADVTTCSLEIVLRTTFGYDSSKINECKEIGSSIEQYFHLISRRIINVHHYNDFIYRWTKDYKQKQSLRAYLDNWAKFLLNEVAHRYPTRSTEPKEEQDVRKPKIFVDELYTNKMIKFTNKELMDNAFTMVGAGTDTSSNSVACTLLSLGMYPETQQRVYEEVMRVYPTDESEFTPDSLKQLEYMEMVIKETLRLFPVGPLILRQSVADSTIAGLFIPKGNMFGIDIFNMHRRKDIYGDDADQFNPERFSPERSKNRNPFSFLAFSGGARGCIGIRYAMMSMKIMVAYMVKNFVIKSKLKNEDLRFKFDIILRMKNGYLVQLEKRNKNN